MEGHLSAARARSIDSSSSVQISVPRHRCGASSLHEAQRARWIGPVSSRETPGPPSSLKKLVPEVLVAPHVETYSGDPVRARIPGSAFRREAPPASSLLEPLNNLRHLARAARRTALIFGRQGLRLHSRPAQRGPRHPRARRDAAAQPLSGAELRSEASSPSPTPPPPSGRSRARRRLRFGDSAVSSPLSRRDAGGARITASSKKKRTPRCSSIRSTSGTPSNLRRYVGRRHHPRRRREARVAW